VKFRPFFSPEKIFLATPGKIHYSPPGKFLPTDGHDRRLSLVSLSPTCLKMFVCLLYRFWIDAQVTLVNSRIVFQLSSAHFSLIIRWNLCISCFPFVALQTLNAPMKALLSFACDHAACTVSNPKLYRRKVSER